MADIPYRTALIVGAGPGISGSVARGLAKAGLKVGLGGPQHREAADLARETGAVTFAADASDPAAVAHLFVAVLTAARRARCRALQPERRVPVRSRRSTRRPCATRWRFSAFGGFLATSRRRNAC